MTRKELLQTIEDIENGLAMNPTGEILERLTSRLQRAKNQLAELEKKSEPQPEQEQPKPTIPPLQQRQAAEYRARGWEEKARQAEREGVEIQQIMERVLVATVTPSAVVQVPAVAITLKRERTVERDGKRTKETVEEVCTMTQGEILTKLKTDFKGLVNTPGWLGKKYTEGKAGVMGYNVRELFKGWNAIHQVTTEGEPWPLITDVYAGYRHTSQDQRIGCEVLWRWASGEG